jgi:Na+/H+ antiporter NhaC
LCIDLLLFGVRFGNKHITFFERISLWLLIFLGAASIISVIPKAPEPLSKAATTLVVNYGYQATMLSFVFGFILFFIAEFKSRKEKLNDNNEKKLNLLINEIGYLKDELSKLNKLESLENEINSLSKKLTNNEVSIKKPMVAKTAQNKKKTKK